MMCEPCGVLGDAFGVGSSGDGRETPNKLGWALAVLSASPSSLEASPARVPAAQANGRDSGMPSPFCGTPSGASLGRFDPDTFSLRTFGTPCRLLLDQGSLLDPSGELYWPTWPRSGLVTSDGTCYPLRPSAPRTCVSGFSPLLPTPRASERENRQTQRTPSQEAGTHGLSLLAETVALLPTPVKGDAKNARQSTAKNPRSDYDTLSDLAYKWQGLTDQRSVLSGASTDPPSPDGQPSTGLRLNPSFVEWMQGAPLCSECNRGWTDPDCPHAATVFVCMWDGSPGGTSWIASEGE